MNSIIQNTAQFVREELEGLCSAHDFYHIERVWKLAQKLHAEEKRGDALVIELAALLHESFDEKFYTKERILEKKVELGEFLIEQGLNKEQLEKVFFVIENVGYGKSLERGNDFVVTDELAIVEDADRLEAIGAIAIARTFTYGGKKKRAIFDPNETGADLSSHSSYSNSDSSSIQHFYDKLLKLKDLLHTSSARALAEKRHIFMEQFLEQFFREWNLND